MKQKICAALAVTLWMVPLTVLANFEDLGIKVRTLKQNPARVQEQLNMKHNPYELDADTTYKPEKPQSSMDLSSQIPADADPTK